MHNCASVVSPLVGEMAGRPEGYRHPLDFHVVPSDVSFSIDDKKPGLLPAPAPHLLILYRRPTERAAVLQT